MRITNAQAPGWEFDVEEVSAGVYRVTAVDSVGRRVEMTGEDPEATLSRCAREAGMLAAPRSGRRT